MYKLFIMSGSGAYIRKEEDFLKQLKSVSRSFYLTLRVLPIGARQPIAIAYLLARAADTIADSTSVPAAERLEGLAALRCELENFTGKANKVAPSIIRGVDNLAERRLLESLSVVFAEFHALSSQDSASIIKVIRVLVSGMELDINRFHQSNMTQLIALENSAELDDYTYRVAGCVGAFWTEIISKHDSALAHWNVTAMSKKGIAYGKALQLTNILRDLPEDLRDGRCYLPRDALFAVHLIPEQLLNLEQNDTVKPVFQHWLKQALIHYDEGEQYILAIPRHCFRLRLAALWPLLMGLATLVKVAQSGRYIDVSQRIKVTRPWVYRMIIRSLFYSLSNRLIKSWIAGLRNQLEETMVR